MNEERRKQRKEHEEKYRKLNQDHGVKWSNKSFPIDGWTEDMVRVEMHADPNLNFVPLAWWDGQSVMLMTTGLSLSQRVCMLKQACRDYLAYPVLSTFKHKNAAKRKAQQVAEHSHLSLEKIGKHFGKSSTWAKRYRDLATELGYFTPDFR